MHNVNPLTYFFGPQTIYKFLNAKSFPATSWKFGKNTESRKIPDECTTMTWVTVDIKNQRVTLDEMS